MNNEVRIKVTGQNDAGPAFKGVADDAERAERKVRDLSESTDRLDESGSHATSSLGALGSGFELLGKTNVQDKLNQVALATDFLSGVGEGATLVMQTFKGGISGVKDKLGGFAASLKDGESKMGSFARSAGAGVLAVGALLAVTQTIGATMGTKLNPQIDALRDSLTKFGRDGTKSGEAARLLGKDFEHLDYDLGSLGSGGMAKAGNAMAGLVENITGLGDVADESLKHATERIQAIDSALAAMVAAGHSDEATAAYTRLQAAARKAGISQADLANGLPKYTAEQNKATLAAQHATDEYETNADAIQRVSNALKAQTDPLFAVIDAQGQVAQAQRDYNAALKAHGERSADARGAELALDKATIGLATSLAGAASGTGHLTAEQRDLLESAGASADRVKELDNRLHAAWLQAQKLDGFKVDVTIAQHFKMFGKPYSTEGIQSGQVGGLAHGGIKGAANGSSGGGLTWVGEHGPELADLPPGTSMHSNPDSMRMAGGGGGGPVTLVIESGGSKMDDLLVEILRNAVRVKGGGSVKRLLQPNPAVA